MHFIYSNVLFGFHERKEISVGVRKNVFNENEAILKRDVKIFKAESLEHKKERHDKVCKRCTYRAYELDNSNAQTYGNVCDYILKTGHIRPCAPSDCVKKKVFVEGNRLQKGKKLQKLHD